MSLRRGAGVVLRVGIFIVLVGLGAYLLFGASDEKRVLNVMRELAAGMSSQPGDTDSAREQRFQAALGHLAESDVLLEIPERGQQTGAPAISALFAETRGIPLRASIDQATVHTEGDRARATLLVSVAWTSMGTERREVRTVTAELVRRASGFLIHAVRVSERSRAQPEARP